jgi:hypothetical protein
VGFDPPCFVTSEARHLHQNVAAITKSPLNFNVMFFMNNFTPPCFDFPESPG